MPHDVDEIIQKVNYRYRNDTEYILERLEQEYNGQYREILYRFLKTYDLSGFEDYSDGNYSHHQEQYYEQRWRDCTDEIFNILDQYHDELDEARNNVEKCRESQRETERIITLFSIAGVTIGILTTFIDSPNLQTFYILSTLLTTIIISIIIALSLFNLGNSSKKLAIAKNVLR